MRTPYAIGTCGAPDRPWQLRPWSGMSAGAWLRALMRNHFAVAPERIPMAALVTATSVFNSLASSAQRLLLGSRVRQTRLVADPVFVLGHWRSGTTLLHELLIQDPQFTYPNTVASFAPNHFLLTEKFLGPLIASLLPKHRPMDNMAVNRDSPQEDEWALCNMGSPSPYLGFMFPRRLPQDEAYQDLRTLTPKQRLHWQGCLLRFLQCLTYRSPRRIVLKSPLHTGRLRVLLELFPRASFVHIVRHPFAVIPSTLHTQLRLSQYYGLQRPDVQLLKQHILDTFSRMYDRFREDANLIPADSFTEIRYEDLAPDPVTCMARIYRELGLGGGQEIQEAWKRYVAGVAGYQTNRYELSDRDRKEIVEKLEPYFQIYGYSRQEGEK